MFKDTIEKLFGEATVERQETWKTFVIGPIPKTIRDLDGIHNTMEGPLQEELAFNEEPYGYIRICVPEIRADKFPSRLRIFGEAVSVQRIRQRNEITVCDKCFGFHATRVCARSKKCGTCGADAHNGTCPFGPRCLNCRGPHSSNDVSCPARPRRSNGSDEAGTGLISLLNCTDTPYFIGSDFNLRHPLWDLKIDHPLATFQALIDWYSSRGLRLLNPTEMPSHNSGGTLDLAFSSDQRARCEIRSDLHTTSNHETLVSTLSRESMTQNPSKLRYDAMDDNLFLQLLGRNQNYDSINTQFELEEEAKDILEIIHTALSGSCPRTKARKVGTSWWNEECKQASKAYCIARCHNSSILKRKIELRAAVRRAKNNHWNSLIAEVGSLPDVYKFVKWHNAAQRYQSPPLHDDDDSTEIQEPLAKAQILYRKLLCRHLDVMDIPPDTPT
ncbi:hypothetical protein EPUL_004811, partial [Erysiphe pulchra]